MFFVIVWNIHNEANNFGLKNTPLQLAVYTMYTISNMYPEHSTQLNLSFSVTNDTEFSSLIYCYYHYYHYSEFP